MEQILLQDLCSIDISYSRLILIAHPQSLSIHSSDIKNLLLLLNLDSSELQFSQNNDIQLFPNQIILTVQFLYNYQFKGIQFLFSGLFNPKIIQFSILLFLKKYHRYHKSSYFNPFTFILRPFISDDFSLPIKHSKRFSSLKTYNNKMSQIFYQNGSTQKNYHISTFLNNTNRINYHANRCHCCLPQFWIQDISTSQPSRFNKSRDNQQSSLLAQNKILKQQLHDQSNKLSKKSFKNRNISKITSNYRSYQQRNYTPFIRPSDQLSSISPSSFFIQTLKSSNNTKIKDFQFSIFQNNSKVKRYNQNYSPQKTPPSNIFPLERKQNIFTKSQVYPLNDHKFFQSYHNLCNNSILQNNLQTYQALPMNHIQSFLRHSEFSSLANNNKVYFQKRKLCSYYKQLIPIPQNKKIIHKYSNIPFSSFSLQNNPTQKLHQVISNRIKKVPKNHHLQLPKDRNQKSSSLILKNKRLIKENPIENIEPLQKIQQEKSYLRVQKQKQLFIKIQTPQLLSSCNQTKRFQKGYEDFNLKQQQQTYKQNNIQYFLNLEIPQSQKGGHSFIINTREREFSIFSSLQNSQTISPNSNIPFVLSSQVQNKLYTSIDSLNHYQYPFRVQAQQQQYQPLLRGMISFKQEFKTHHLQQKIIQIPAQYSLNQNLQSFSFKNSQKNLLLSIKNVNKNISNSMAVNKSEQTLSLKEQKHQSLNYNSSSSLIMQGQNNKLHMQIQSLGNSQNLQISQSSNILQPRTNLFHTKTLNSQEAQAISKSPTIFSNSQNYIQNKKFSESLFKVIPSQIPILKDYQVSQSKMYRKASSKSNSCILQIVNSVRQTFQSPKNVGLELSPSKTLYLQELQLRKPSEQQIKYAQFLQFDINEKVGQQYNHIHKQPINFQEKSFTQLSSFIPKSLQETSKLQTKLNQNHICSTILIKDYQKNKQIAKQFQPNQFYKLLKTPQAKRVQADHQNTVKNMNIQSLENSILAEQQVLENISSIQTNHFVKSKLQQIKPNILQYLQNTEKILPHFKDFHTVGLQTDEILQEICFQPNFYTPFQLSNTKLLKQNSQQKSQIINKKLKKKIKLAFCEPQFCGLTANHPQENFISFINNNPPHLSTSLNYQLNNFASQCLVKKQNLSNIQYSNDLKKLGQILGTQVKLLLQDFFKKIKDYQKSSLINTKSLKNKEQKQCSREQQIYNVQPSLYQNKEQSVTVILQKKKQALLNEGKNGGNNEKFIQSYQQAQSLKIQTLILKEIRSSSMPKILEKIQYEQLPVFYIKQEQLKLPEHNTSSLINISIDFVQNLIPNYTSYLVNQDLTKICLYIQGQWSLLITDFIIDESKFANIVSKYLQTPNIYSSLKILTGLPLRTLRDKNNIGNNKKLLKSIKYLLQRTEKQPKYEEEFYGVSQFTKEINEIQKIRHFLDQNRNARTVVQCRKFQVGSKQKSDNKAYLNSNYEGQIVNSVIQFYILKNPYYFKICIDKQLTTYQIELTLCVLYIPDPFKYILYEQKTKNEYVLIKETSGWFRYHNQKEHAKFLLIIEPYEQQSQPKAIVATIGLPEDKFQIQKIKIIKYQQATKAKGYNHGYENRNSLYLPVQKEIINQTKDRSKY